MNPSDQREVVGEGDGGDHQVVGANQLSLARQFRAEAAIDFGGAVVKWQADELTEKPVEQG